MISVDILSNPTEVFEREWCAVTESTKFAEQTAKIEQLVSNISAQEHPNEPQTKQDLIFPILQLLDWPEFLIDQNLSLRDRASIPDILLFSTQQDKVEASKISIEAKRYERGICMGEFKRWGTNLDRHAGTTPSPTSQLLHYLRRNQDINNSRGAQWGILTDGKKWRIYYARSQSVTEDYLEIDLETLINPVQQTPTMLDAVGSNLVKKHVLGLFVFFFSRNGFSNHDDLSRHLRAIAAGRHYEARVTSEMGDVIFNVIYPKIAVALANHSPDSSVDQIRDEALLLLFRILFILYAEDRGLLPTHNNNYRYHRSFRIRVREKIREFHQLAISPARSSNDFWSTCRQLWDDIAQGNVEFGLPAYNGDLFDPEKTPILNEILFDDVFLTEIIEPLSFQKQKYVNYRTLNVQHLGAIYERLLIRKVIVEEDEPKVVSDPSSRKETGSYYTPDYIVRLTIEKTLSPLVSEIYRRFEEELLTLEATAGTEQLIENDPAQSILELRVCDPAMGSAHFLVDAVDWLSDRVLEALARCNEELPDYISPVSRRIAEIRDQILQRALNEGWRILDQQLDDRQIVKRLVLKKCIYGVDLNPMAVELAKLSLWLHTFTVGAPLSFLNHHLRCGNSIFGSWVTRVAQSFDTDIFQLDLSNVLRKTTVKMRTIEELPDSDLDEVRQSEELFRELADATSTVKRFLDVHLGLTWLRPTNVKNEHNLDLSWLTNQTTSHARQKEQESFDAQVANWYEGRDGDPLSAIPAEPKFRDLWNQAHTLAAEQKFLHWEVAFPGVWNHQSNGFDAILGNPPWERIKFEEAEWIAYRKPDFARNMTQKEREGVFGELLAQGDPLVQAFYESKAKASHTMMMIRHCEDYPLTSSGDINIYGLFAERALTLLNEQGVCGLVLMSGIAADQSCTKFFQHVSQRGRLRNFYHFENRRTTGGRHFADVHGQLKFCIFVASAQPNGDQAHYGCFVDDVTAIDTGNKCFNLAADFLRKVNPNTGSIPILRSHADREILERVYDTTPILQNHASNNLLYPVRFTSMFHMTKDRKEGKMLTRSQLDKQERIWALANHVFESDAGRWLPLYEGKMIWQFDHRAADVKFNPDAPLKRASAEYLDDRAHEDPLRSSIPQFWVLEKHVEQRLQAMAKQIVRDSPAESESEVFGQLKTPFFLGFRDITNTTDRRTMISTILPYSAVSNTLCLLMAENTTVSDYAINCSLLVGNFGSLIFDYIARCKLHANHMNWFILEQLPVIPRERYEKTKFGLKTATKVVGETVVELVYNAHALTPFAEAIGFVNTDGIVQEPFPWDSDRRLSLRAKLDAVYFHLYGITETAEIDHVHSLFKVEENTEVSLYGEYRSKRLRHHWVNALAAGQVDILH